MEASQWIGEHWSDLIQNVAITGSLLLAVYTSGKDEQARRTGNLIAVNEQYVRIWLALNERPEFSRILEPAVDLCKQPVTGKEMFGVKMLILHLDTVRRAMKAGLFVKIEGLRNDICHFLSLPIPKSVWLAIKPFQDAEFIAFVEDSLK